MGLDINGVRLLLVAKSLGTDFKDVVTIGRQGLYVTEKQLEDEFLFFNMPYKEKAVATGGGYSEKLFALLGAQEIQSIDNSDYEAATITHDMNKPIPEELKRRFSVVVDAGTLEHVFNYPVAIKNCMELLKEGGTFISITPANNFMGHGFYQFSPELFFSIFTRGNGFSLLKLFISEIYGDSPWYEVSKPKGGNAGRVTLINHHSTFLMCIAKRVDGACEPFRIRPQQSDYVEAWEMKNKEDVNLTNQDISIEPAPAITKLKSLFKKMPAVMSLIRLFRYLIKPAFSRRDYTKIHLDDLRSMKNHE